ncbi:MAG: T9SS type A sorting domain-containing protein [Saprospiraceae bacterium]|nr:T9SS type A sorting domain-containing protein [Saprospiraceae bacterium]
MKKTLLLLFCAIGALSSFAQDTIKVQTFTWADNQRADTFNFPDDPSLSFRKILMIYNMRCHNAAVGNGNVGCYEWDYSCNTFITDPTRVDSTRAQAPSHIISNFSGTAFPYSLSPTYVYTRYIQHESSLQANGPISESQIGNQGQPTQLAPAATTFRYQGILQAADLSAGGLQAGALYGLKLTLEQAGSTVGFFKIRLKNTTQSVSGEQPDNNGLVEVYHKNTDLSTIGDMLFPFYQSFNWTGGNLLVDISFTTAQISDAPVFRFFETLSTDAALVSMPGAVENSLVFDGACAMNLPGTTFASIQNEVTIAFWNFGNADALPTSTHFLEGKDAAGRRQATLHLPWSNSEIYWDCGGDASGYDRINKPAMSSEFEGRWNHWAFTKNTATGNMSIFLNGQLWHTATGKTKPIDIQSFRVGKSLTNDNPYYGAIDEFQVWDKALDAATIQSWMFKKLDNTHPNYNNLVGYYQLNEGNGFVADNASNLNIDGSIVQPKWQQVRGSDLFHDFSISNLLPLVTFLQGDYAITDTALPVLDSVVATQHQVVSYGLNGTTLVALDTQLVFQGGQRPVYDESGAVVDSVFADVDGVIEIQTIVHYTKRQAKYELLSLVTPYGNGLDLGQNGKTFTFDVTDFAPILKGSRRLSLEYGGENQEELDIEFWFITGTPDRNVIDIQPIWPQGRGGFGGIQNDQVFEPRILPLRNDASYFKVRSAITGHEQNGEFVSREHYINLNGGTQEFTYNVWKACGKNPIYPQGGTWVFDRAGWCPGMATDVREFALDGLVQPGQSVEFDYGVNGPNLASANYLVNNQLVSFGAYNFPNDASIEAIVRPNKDQVEFERLNPACNAPTVRVKNGGFQVIESIKFEYTTGPGFVEQYTWTGNLDRQQMADIALPAPPTGFWSAGTTFTATILEVNGGPDYNPDNNFARTNFTPAKNFNYPNNIIQLRLITNNTGADYSYRIKDGAGAVVLERNMTASNTTYTEDLTFPGGCYTLEFDDAGNDGLSFWFYPNNGNGSLRFQRKLPTGIIAPIQAFNADFGAGVQFDFTLPAMVDSEEATDHLQLFSAYPNPTSDVLNIDVVGYEGKELRLQLFDLTGKMVVEKTFQSVSEKETTQLELGELAAGMYILRCTDGKKSWAREIVKN